MYFYFQNQDGIIKALEQTTEFQTHSNYLAGKSDGHTREIGFKTVSESLKILYKLYMFILEKNLSPLTAL